MAAEEDLILMIGELYVAQRMLTDGLDKSTEQKNQMRIDGAEVQTRLDEALARVDELEAKLAKKKGGKK